MIGEVLVRAEPALPVHTVRVDLAEILPGFEDLVGVVVMGGDMGVHDEVEFPWLPRERDWLAGAVGAGIPLVGVCLGAQQLALALGAEVTTGPAPEIGLGEVTVTPEGGADPLLGPERDRLPCLHWHGDTFAVPAGAVRIATGDRYQNQGFRFGDTAWGLQFHIEVDRELLDDWVPDLPEGVVVDEAGRAEVEAAGRRVFSRFAALALARSSTWAG